MTTTTIHTLLEEFRQTATSERDKGDKFERLVATYLTIDPIYKEKYSDVWLWSEWPKRHNQPDTGIDLVAQDRYTNEYTAIQCKFYNPKHTLDKSDIDSFFTASGKAPFTSRMIVSTTDRWTNHAEEALRHQTPPVTRLSVQDLADSPVDWTQFSFTRPQNLKLKPKKQLYPHQQAALEKVMAGFEKADRGKMIMACGTGKTFTALKIAERMAVHTGYVLFLVPSISLMSQSLREWTAEAELSLHCFAVCSDSQVVKKGKGSTTEISEDISSHDLAFPATTNPRQLAAQVDIFGGKKQLTVIFSTYQSIQVISDAQNLGLPEFDLIICDEAHRTTGVALANEDESHFVKVHRQNFIQAKKRLYMTATPRLYGDNAKSKAQENEVVLCSMDDEQLYGQEFHRLGFGEAVNSNLLSDYKVIVLAIDEKFVSKAFQAQIADDNNEINLDDAVKITGCWNGLSKRMVKDGQEFEGDNAPMRRAVAFARSIKDSEQFARLFAKIMQENQQQNSDLLQCEVEHVDGTFNALRRNEKLEWLKSPTTDNVCRILSNVRCLSEGVDVPALDAVMFLTPRNSEVDVVQSVGRVMRKAEGKKYGYIILPVGIPADMTPESALQDNMKYKVIWQVLQALRSHDDRFNAIVNQIELNTKRPDRIQIIGVGGGEGEGEGLSGSAQPIQLNLPYIVEWRDAIYAKIVQKCGEREYWDNWAKEVAYIAERHISRIKALLAGANPEHRLAFADFLKGLQLNLNPSVSEADAIEMLSQHLITKPVFDALFEGYAFTQHNPVSLAMQKMLDLMERQALEKETGKLDKFYESVKRKATGIDNAAGRQKIIIELYDKFFKAAFPRMAERLGIVYTPVEVVDFIIKSADAALRQEFGVGLTTEGVHVLDPFTGTGTFMVRLLQSGLIDPADLRRKYEQELHANEIILLAYYIAAINIESTYHDQAKGEYQPFNGIVLTDTFQQAEGKGSFEEKMFPENNERVARQKQHDIRVIVGNPPYSAGQENANDNNQNLSYPHLDERISSTYIENSSKKVGKSTLYDSYIRAIRWASDRIKDNGIICYVSSGSFIDSNSMDGLRKCLTDEFTAIYCFNLRGNARSSGEQRRMEKGNVFGEGTRTPVAITIVVKNPAKIGQCQLYYHDIGDYLSREEKLKIITDFGSIKGIKWEQLTPNDNHDWIDQRDPLFNDFISLGDKNNLANKTVFNLYSMGIKTNRDDWVYNFTRTILSENMTRMINFYNQQVNDYLAIPLKHRPEIANFISTDSTKIKWTEDVIKNAAKGVKYTFEAESIRQVIYRPFCKQWLYYNKAFNWTHHLIPKIFPNASLENLVIYLSGANRKEFSTLIVNCPPDLNMQHSGGQGFPLYYYEKTEANPLSRDMFASAAPTGEYVRKDAIPDSILAEFRKTYTAPAMTKEDIFYYVYGILYSPEYKRRFADDLKKMLPRIPFAQDFWAFSKAGRALAAWHLNYETIEPYPLTERKSRLDLEATDYRVQKMTFGRNGKEIDKSTIVYNSNLTLSGIPLEAYDYIVNGKSALDWIMERYQVTVDKDSGIKNDPNDWSDDPRYIVDLVKRIVRVSLETVQIVNALPALNEAK